MTAEAFDKVPTLKLLIVPIGTMTLALLGDNSSANQSPSTASFTLYTTVPSHQQRHISHHCPVWIKKIKTERRSTSFPNASSCLLFDPRIYYIMRPSGIKNSIVQMVYPQEPCWSMTITAKQCNIDIWVNTVMRWT